MSREVEFDERPRCPRCGGPMDQRFALACGRGGFSEQIPLPPSCADRECGRAGQAERDEAAIARAIAAGVIDQ